MTLVDKIGEFAVRSREHRDSERTAAMRPFLADYLVLARAGSETAPARAARDAVADSGASILEGDHGRVSARSAALINGIAAHALELDDTHEEGSLHPAVAVWPAVLGVADEVDAVADDVLVAGQIGYDVMCAVATLGGAADIYARGFHPTGVAGSLGAAAAVASLRGGDSGDVSRAVAIAANVSAGSLEFLSDGSWTKPLNAGWAAMVGVLAVDLAQAGFIAPATAIEGTFGWLTLYADGHPDTRTLDLSPGAGAAATSIKFYPCCRYIHGAIDLLSDIAREEGPFAAIDVESIDVAVLDAGRALVADPPERKVKVDGQVDAQFSMPFGAALALTKGGAGLEDFVGAAHTARDLRPLMEKVRSIRSEALEREFPAMWGAEVTVTLTDGRVIGRSEPAFKGAPARPATKEDIMAKAASLIGGDAARRIVDVTYEFDAERPVSQVLPRA